jgi:hypothetical protein
MRRSDQPASANSHSLKGTCFQPLNLSSEKLVSKFAYCKSVNLCGYVWANTSMKTEFMTMWDGFQTNEHARVMAGTLYELNPVYP